MSYNRLGQFISIERCVPRYGGSDCAAVDVAHYSFSAPVFFLRLSLQHRGNCLQPQRANKLQCAFVPRSLFHFVFFSFCLHSLAVAFLSGVVATLSDTDIQTQETLMRRTTTVAHP
jgi:hypothetical protein